MSDIAALSIARANLPAFAPGQPLPVQLQVGRDAARAALAKYVPSFAFDVAAAEDTLRKIEVWEERNKDALAAALADPTSEKLSEAIQIAFGSTAMQQFLLATYTRAAAGLGPWTSGRIATEAARGDLIQQRWAEEDAGYRLQVFGGIVKMEQDGFLKKVFVPPAGASGLGVAPVAAAAAVPAAVYWAIAIASVLVVSAVLLWSYASFRLLANNRLMREMCLRAQNEGDSDTVEACLDATRELQIEDVFPGAKGFVQTLAVFVGIGLLGWAALNYIPEWLGRRAERRLR